MQQQQIEAQERQLQMAQQFKAEEAEKDRAARLTEAEIKAAGYGSMADINKNMQSDYLDAMDRIKDEQRYQDTMNIKRESENFKREQGAQRIEIDREKLQTQKEIADKQLQIAKENKNKYDEKGSSKKEK
jgi:hypothetical protein